MKSTTKKDKGECAILNHQQLFDLAQPSNTNIPIGEVLRKENKLPNTIHSCSTNQQSFKSLNHRFCNGIVPLQWA